MPAGADVTLEAIPHHGPSIRRARRQRWHVLPGFRLSLGITLLYLLLMVLLPLLAVVLKAGSLGWEHFWQAATSERVVASYRLSFGMAMAAALLNTVFGVLLAWVLVRYPFPGKRVVDALIDLPFALPTAVAGIALTALYARNGWLGQWLEPLGLKVAFQPLGVFVALAFARGVGEYGSVIFIAGNLPMVSEIAPLLIISKLEQYDYAGATAIAVVMLSLSLIMLLLINGLQGWLVRRQGAPA
ncbi:sulfate ABC transporter permease subunit CysT [Leeia sp.]|uniref:sulfate ABC transporter permease subunit CysT n=1 Tax=Leeia sp. TaxID=2884678 RepID=UPI0035B270E1